MTEFEQILVGDGYAAPPKRILDGLANPQTVDALTHQKPAGAPHSIYEELWHVVFWQQVTLEWVSGIETPYRKSSLDGFPTVLDMEKEPFGALSNRFFEGLNAAVEAANDTSRHDREIRCTSRPGQPARVMTMLEQLQNLAAHNAYHLGRIVLLRQLLGVWPPPSGGDSW
ncbi:MAG: DinB family protein [Terracidiphilus sp.]